MAKAALWFWATMTIVWIILLIPSLLIWKDSILWIIIMSWWANVAASAAAVYSIHTEIKAKQRDEHG